MSREPLAEEVADIIRSARFEKWVLAKYHHWTLYLNAGDQAFPGRAYLWLNSRHIDRMSITALTDDELQIIQKILYLYEEAIKQLRPVTTVNVEWLGNEVSLHRGHGHWHLIPRHPKPVQVCGIEFVDVNPMGRRKNERVRLADDHLIYIRDELRRALVGPQDP